MSVADDFVNKFDTEGQFRELDGILKVVFATKGGRRFPGQLRFRDGLCVRAEMEVGGDWANPDNSPIDGVRFLLDLGDEKLHAAAIVEGRVSHLAEAKAPSSKEGFLANLRVARNLFVHSQRDDTVTRDVETAPFSESLTRAAVWLTPRSVAGFNADDFPELGPAKQAQLLAAVQSFKAVADQVPSDKPATSEQYGNASVAFARILEILTPYLPIPDEGRKVEEALRNVEFPPWVVNWDFELASDSDGVAAVWVNVFADDRAVPNPQLGQAASELTSKVRQALNSQEIRRWPYIRLRTAKEHKVG